MQYIQIQFVSFVFCCQFASCIDWYQISLSPGTQFKTMAGILYTFPIFPCVLFLGNQFFFGQNKPKEGFLTLYFQACIKEFRCQDIFCPQTLFAYCIYIYI